MSKVTVNSLLALEPGGLYYDGKPSDITPSG